jgi:hypothetical protein
VWPDPEHSGRDLRLAALFASFVFDYLARFGGRSNLTYGAMNSIPAPSVDALQPLEEDVRRLLAIRNPGEFASLHVGPTPANDAGWEGGRVAARIDARVALSYCLTLKQFAAVLLTFPRLDRSQPMLPGEPKCFVTRDMALAAFCEVAHIDKPDVAKLMREIDISLPDPNPEHRDVDARLYAYRRLGAIPYVPTPRGARVPTDPMLIDEVLAFLSDDALTPTDLADVLGAGEEVVTKILKDLRKSGDVYVEGRGKNARYYVVGDD